MVGVSEMVAEVRKLDLRGRLSVQIDYDSDGPPCLDFLLDKNPQFRGITSAREIWDMFEGKRIRMRIEVIE